jgi:hypothetical protein
MAQQVSLTGKVINPDEKPIKNVLVYLVNNPTLYCYSDSLGNFSLIDEIGTSVTEVRQNEIISFENRKLSLYANNQSISVDVITIDGRLIMNIVNLDKSLGTFGLYPEAYISGLPKAIYIVRARVGDTFQSFKIQNIIPSSFPQGITEYDINNIINNSFSEPKSMTKSGVTDTLVLVHDFYKSRKIPLVSYSMHYDSIHLNNYADYTIAEGFKPSVTQLYNRYANFTDIFSADSVQFIIDYDTLSILEGDQKVITIPIDKIEGLDNSIEFISGLHFEPSGTQFLQPVQVSVLMKDSIPEDLVVFHYNDQGETYFIPYEYLFNDGHSIIFNINHFSSIGIGTGEIPTTNPDQYTTSDQFISYLTKYMFNYEAVTDGFFTIWYNNVVVPMINNIITDGDLLAAYKEFLVIEEYFETIGMGNFEQVSFYDSAIELFSDKMKKIWNECIEEYNGLNDNCLKREILYIASNIVTLSNLNTDLYQANIDDFGNGEIHNLANKIEFAKQLKHLEVGESYIVQYILKSPSGNPLPESVSWSSSNTSVATINSDGEVTGKSKGVTIITGNICDKVENTFKVEVGGFNCEEHYCENEDYSCYSGVYKGTGVINFYLLDWWGPPYDCVIAYVRDRITITLNLGGSDIENLVESTWSSERYLWSSQKEDCEMSYETQDNSDDEPDFSCRKKGAFSGGSSFYEFEGRLLVNYTSEGIFIGNVLYLSVNMYVPNVGKNFDTVIQCSRIDQ